MPRLIDADALITAVLKNAIDYAVVFGDSEMHRLLVQVIAHQPTIDAVPSETLYDFIREIGAITYGKERFFLEEIGVHCGLWYDRKSGEWITTKTAIEECLKAVRELDDGVLDEVPVKRGKWIYGNDFHWYTASCNRCGYQRRTDIKADRWNQWNYCPNCGADMRGESNE